MWTGQYFLVIGGSANYALPVPGPGTAAYDPSTNRWTALPTAPEYPQVGLNSPTFPADQREGGLAVWTGKSAVVLGGLDFHRQGTRADGVKWTPAHARSHPGRRDEGIASPGPGCLVTFRGLVTTERS